MRLVRMNREITMDILVLIQVGGGFWGGYFLPSCIYEEGREKKGKLFQREMVENLKKARLFNDSGRLVASTSFVYNNEEAYLLNSDFASLDSADESDAYYSYGITAAYNGNGYTQYYTFKSPSQNP